MLHSFKSGSTVITLYAVLCFPLFYFVYKFGTPFLGMIDFYDYYKLYQDFDFRSADSPLNMRLVGSFFVYCMSKTGVFYNTATSMDNSQFDKVVYFNAVFFNYICVVVTSALIFRISWRQKHTILESFLGGMLYLLGFGTIFFQLMPLTDAFSVLMFAIILQLYINKNPYIVIPLLLLILQREYLFFAVALIALMDYYKYRLRFYMLVFIVSVLCFLVYFVLRKMIFETERYAYQTNFKQIIESVFHDGFPLGAFLRQTIMTMNLFFIYLALVAYKYFKKIPFNKFEFYKIMAVLIQLIILSFLLGLGNNTGRYFYFLSPLIIVMLLNEMRVFNWDKGYSALKE